ncbi:MAG: hypothetical protein KAQ68_00885, partial [Clostridiales bacterium]|nr:hypothetical protein [Clostridiales bacterium]
DLDIQNILNVYMNNDGDIPYDGMQSKYIYVASEDNVFLSSGEVSPEQAIYYVGETVQITDRFRNSLAIAATDVSVAYYHRLTGGYLSNKNPIDLGTVAAKATAENVFDYTFTEDDIGALRIGSELTYSVSGIGPYNEFNIAHDFVVEAAPVATDTPLPSETPAPSDTPIPSDTATPTDTSETEATQAPAQEGASYTVIVTSDGASADDDDEVMFNIKVKNTGTVVLSDVKVFDGQTLLSTIGDIQVGEAVSVPITQEVSESDDKFFTVTAQYGDEKLSEYSNLIEIEVTPEEDAGTASGLLGDLFGGNNTLMVIIIGVLGLIALSLVVLVIVVVARKKK